MKVNDTDPRVSAMQLDWELIDTLLGGTRAMRLAGERYLPRYSMESDQDYKARLQTATLFPALAQTVRNLTGRVFGETLQPEEDVPAWIRSDIWPDIDLQDANGHVFAREWWRYGVSHGLCHVLVEGPPSTEIRTQADQRAAGARPYCILIKPQRVLGWMHDADGQLSQLRLTWSRTEREEFGETTVPQVRVYDRVQTDAGWRVQARDFEQVKRGDAQAEWVMVNGPVLTGLEFIPLATFYTGKTAPMVAEPPLRELAHLNAKHWAMEASADSLLQVASVPVLCATGVDETTKITVGANAAVNLPLGADLKYVEHTGQAISTGADRLKALEEQMKAIGARLIEPNTGTKTATQAGEDAQQANSTLAGWVQDFGDSMAALLDIIASYRGEPKGGRVEIHADLDPDSVPNETAQVLLKAQAQGMISPQTLFHELQRRGLVSGDVNWDEEQQRITLQQPEPAQQQGAP